MGGLGREGCICSPTKKGGRTSFSMPVHDSAFSSTEWLVSDDYLREII